MTLEALTSRDTIDVYTLTTTQDRGLHTVEALGTLVSEDVKCRAIVETYDQQMRYGEQGGVQRAKFLFSTDPSITLTHAIIYDSLVWRVRSIGDSSGRVWHVIAEQMPQVELEAP